MTDILLIAGKLNNKQSIARLGKVEDGETPVLSTLVKAENLDIDNNGAVTLRNGRELKLSNTAHSLWVHPGDDKIAYFVDNFVLKKLNTDFSATTIATLNSNTEAFFGMVNSEIVVMNGVDVGWVKHITYDPFDPTLAKFEAAVPSGQYFTFFKGVLYVVAGSVLYASKPHNVEKMDTRYCAFPMTGYIRMIGSVDDGLWIGTDSEIGFIHGNSIDEFKYEHVTSNVCPSGCFKEITEEEEKEIKPYVIWTSEEGFCCGGNSGSYENKSYNQCALPKGSSGKIISRFNNGIRQYVAIINNNTDERTWTEPDITVNEKTIS